MERIKYLFIFAIIILIFKAMFLDDYLKNRENQEINGSVESEEISQPSETSAAAEYNTTVKSTPPPQTEPVKKELPLDKLGNSIAEKIKL